MFAGSCVGVVCLVVVLELLRRTARAYDAHIVHQALSSRCRLAPLRQQQREQRRGQPDQGSDPASLDDHRAAKLQTATACSGDGSDVDDHGRAGAGAPARQVRPSAPQQLLRATLHMLQFAVAYFIMLLAMYFNGYIIICIFIGSFLGALVFAWEPLSLGASG